MSFTKEFEIEGDDFANAGRVSTEIKAMLKSIGYPADVIRRTAIAAYEAEMNVVMYADTAHVNLTLEPGAIHVVVADEGPGIPDIDRAMQEGFSTATDEMRERGFGAGMGLPNIRRNADEFAIESEVGQGTRLDITVRAEEGRV
jgi:anti-sigma regulatory factor (Ser/Thr protein kinase)